VKSFFKDDEPMVHIAVQAGERQQFIWNGVDQGNVEQSESWNWATGDSLKVVCYTNAGEVELFLNGKSLGTRTNNVVDSRQRNRPEWQVAYAAGNLVAVARTGGREVARDRIETAGEARKLTLSPDNNAWKADGLDLQHIRILAVDSKGRRVWNVGSQLHFQVEGPAEIVGLDNGNNYTDELAVGNSHKMYRGSALVILRSTGQAGKVTLSVSSGDFKTQKLMLTTR
jgi:beta-galactosidase